MYMNAVYASSQNEIRKVYFHIKNSYKVVYIIVNIEFDMEFNTHCRNSIQIQFQFPPIAHNLTF